MRERIPNKKNYTTREIHQVYAQFQFEDRLPPAMPRLLESWKLGFHTLLHTRTFRAYLKILAGGAQLLLYSSKKVLPFSGQATPLDCVGSFKRVHTTGAAREQGGAC